MPMQNRVAPTGDIVAIPLRGAWCGNRGIVHRGTDIVRFHASDLWITCSLQFRDRRQHQWQAHHYTLLFFHDEAVSLAAGHRPCAFCRRSDYQAFRAAVVAGGADSAAAGRGAAAVPSAKELDRQLHAERIHRGTHRRRLHPLRWADIPDGAFVIADGGGPEIVLGDCVVPWTTEGYDARRPRPRPRSGSTAAITPPLTLAALRNGYRPQVDTAALPS